MEPQMHANARRCEPRCRNADDLARHEEAERVITMYVAPGVPDSIRPEDVVRVEGESDEEYAERQALTLELWSIPANA